MHRFGRIVLCLVAGAAVSFAVVRTVQEKRKWAKEQALERLYQKQRESSTLPAPQNPEPPPLPPAIDPAVVAAIQAAGAPRPPRGLRDNYTLRQIDRILENLRLERGERPQAYDDLLSWYNYLSDPAFSGSEDYPAHAERIEEWRQEDSQSPTALVILARIHIHHAWEARGTGYAASVTPEGWKLFQERIAVARKLLEQAIDLGAKDGQAHASLLVVAKAEGWTKAQARRVLEAGRQLDPTYFALYTAMAEYLLPRWHGEPGDIERFAAEIADALPGDEGLDAYGHIAFAIHQFEPELLYFGRYDRSRLVEAAEVLVQRYPHAASLVPFAALSTMAAQNHDAARRIQPFIQSKVAPGIPEWWYAESNFQRWCRTREVPVGNGDWIWATHFTFGSLAFDSDPRYLWCGRGDAESPVALLDLKQKSLAMKLLGPGGAVLRLAIDSDRQYVAAIVQRRDYQGQNFQGWVLLWNLANPEKPATRQMDHLPRAIAFRPGAKLLAMGFAREVRTLNLESLADGPTIATSSDVHFLKFSPDGALLAVNDTLVDAATGEKLSDIGGRVVAFDAENRILAIPAIHGPSGAQYPLHRYAANGREHQTLIADLGSNSIAAALAPGGRLFAIADLVRGAGPEGINVWDLETGKLLERLPGHADSIGALAFSDDGQRLASIGRLGGIIRHWPVAGPPEAAPQ